MILYNKVDWIVLVQREMDKRLFVISHKVPLRGVFLDEFF